MKEKSTLFTIIFSVLILGFFVIGIIRVAHFKMGNASFTDGIVTATFNRELGTLTFSGNGAVGGTLWWLNDLEPEQRVHIRTIIFENGITSIGSCEFSDSSQYINLQKVIFEGDINAIGSCAFAGNSNLVAVEFGGDCLRIDQLAFYRCTALKTANIPKECDICDDAFSATRIRP